MRSSEPAGNTASASLPSPHSHRVFLPANTKKASLTRKAPEQSDKQINALLTDDNYRLVEELSKIAGELGVPLSVLSLAWILQKEEISCVIAGASRPSQLENNVMASGLKIPADAMERIEKCLPFKRFERHVG